VLLHDTVAALSRSDEAFYDDVALVDDAGQFRGMICVQTLVYVQSELLSEKVALAEAQGEALRKSEEHLKSILDSVHAGILVLDASQNIIDANAFALELLGSKKEELLGRARSEFDRPAKSSRNPEEDHGGGWNSSECTILNSNGEPLPILHSTVPINRNGRALLIESFIDITEQKKAEQELRALHLQLLEASRQAGMAEVATGVLHNVGNVLNSVSVSATLVSDRMRHSRLVMLSKAATLLSEREADLCAYLTSDPKGRLLPKYLMELGKYQAQEQEDNVKELDLLRKNIEHIKGIVAMQQTYARVSGIVERFPAAQVVDDALQMNAAALLRHGVAVVREYEENLWLCTDKHKVLQVLVNLIRNAKQAMREKDGQNDKQLVVRIARKNPQCIDITMQDNGIGIKSEHMAKLFSHGFTTKKDGHGFGLHMGALVVKEMGGSLSAKSDGPGLGAVFTLELPMANEIAESRISPAQEMLFRALT
jgi:PAS domain S-box-containing protein